MMCQPQPQAPNPKGESTRAPAAEVVRPTLKSESQTIALPLPFQRRRRLRKPKMRPKMAVLPFLLWSPILSGSSTSTTSTSSRKRRNGLEDPKAVRKLLLKAVGKVTDAVTIIYTLYYHVTLSIGQPPKPYSVDIDTGSDITWLQCDAPCTKCIPAPHKPYKPGKNLVTCKDPLCVSIQPMNYECESQDQCDYEIEYADSGSSMGVLVHDVFSLKFINGSISAPRLAFGCGYHQEVPDSIHMPYTDGVLGLGKGKSSILYQLHKSGVIRNVVGHCLSVHGGGFLFFGDDLIPSSGIVWVPLSSSASENYYSLGSAELFFGGQATGIKDLSIILDSGSTYSYLNSQAYSALISLLKKDANGKKLQDAADDKTLPICWKGPKPFKSISDVKSLFKPLQLVLKTDKNIPFELHPEVYLIVTKKGNVCLGILNGSEVGLGDVNLIGDISLQDKLVIYDNEKQRIGWAPANCNRLPNGDHDSCGGYYQPYEANLDILFETCPAYDYKGKRKASEELWHCR